MAAQAARLAFTLAEVLITLGIIAVVAALTMPNLIAEHRKKVLQTQFKAMYSIIYQAVLTTKQDLGSNSLYKDYFVYSPELKKFIYEEEVKEAFYKNLKVVGYASIKTGDYSIYSDKNIKLYYASGGEWSLILPRRVLYNGATIDVALTSGRINFATDINGKKGPNRYGHDLFVFIISDSSDKLTGLKKVRDYTEEELGDLSSGGINNYQGLPCSKNSKQTSNGIGCAWYALNDICPDDETKGYWECLPK